MTFDNSTQPLPEPARHGEKPPRSGAKIALVVVATVLGLAIIALIVLLFARSAATPSSTPTPTPSATPTPTPTATTPASPTACGAGDLTVTLGKADGTAGSTLVPVIFTNSGGRACTLSGYPVVSLVDSSGMGIGSAASPDTTQPISDNTIAPGNSVAALLKVTDAGNVDSCNPQDAVGVKVLPPNLGIPVTIVASGFTGCANGSANIMSVGPVGPVSAG
jgi:hypothetical protein